MIEIRTITSRAEWLGWRRQDITASDIGALFSASPWKSQLHLWAEKTGRAIGTVETPAMRRGRWLQPAVFRALLDAFPTSRVEELAVYARDPTLRLGATPDGMVGHMVVETKVISRPVFEAWQGELPLMYYLQGLTGAMLMDAPRFLVACLVIDTQSADLQIFYFERDPPWEERIREGVAQFWQAMDSGDIPPADYSEDRAVLESIYPPDKALPPLDLGSDNFLPDLLAERRDLKDTINAAGERVAAIETEIIDKLKGAPKAVCNDWRISYSRIEVPAHHRTASAYNRLTISLRKDGQ